MKPVNLQQARIILSAARPGGEDSAAPTFTEALRLAASDPALGQWLERSRAADLAIIERLRQASPPPDLKAAILAGSKVIRPNPPAWRRPAAWLAAAASLALLAAAPFLVRRDAPRPLPFAEFHQDVAAYVATDFTLQTETPRLEEARARLARLGGAPAFTLPKGMSGIPTFGCRVVDIRGHKVSLVCFDAPAGELHLFTLDRRAILAPPGAAPEFGARAGWQTASWSDDRFVYVLASDMPESRLRTFL